MLEAASLAVRLGSTMIVEGVDLNVPSGPYGIGLVGESGSGKTTIARALVRLLPAAEGNVTFRGQGLQSMKGKDLAMFRRNVQVVLQDPDGTLDPRMRAGDALAEVLRAHRIVPRAEVRERVVELLGEVGLAAEHAERFPHQLSGGQRQRVSIARALAVRPQVLILDEPTSALDVTTQAHILELIEQLREERRLSYLLISHNLAVVERLCEEVAVLYLGRIVERGPTSAVLRNPSHPYTAALLAAVPRIGAVQSAHRRVLAPGNPPDITAMPPGCAFHTRCPVAVDRCRVDVPHLMDLPDGGGVACHRAAEIREDHALRRKLR